MKGDLHFDVAGVATGSFLGGSKGLVEFVTFERALAGALAGGEVGEGVEPFGGLLSLSMLIV
jgi:hypothetical protein